MEGVWRSPWFLGGLALAGAALELVNAFFVKTPQASVGIARIFVLAWFRIVQGRMDGTVLAGLLFFFELIGLVFAKRDETADWVIQLSLAVLAIVGLVLVISIISRPRLTPPDG